ncbi:hypothetical protein PM082_007223 [Marasmius tenuissimus]|nr:hypothetical protein PM082_007223 [Marasmius tenuissimus]
MSGSQSIVTPTKGEYNEKGDDTVPMSVRDIDGQIMPSNVFIVQPLCQPELVIETWPPVSTRIPSRKPHSRNEALALVGHAIS